MRFLANIAVALLLTFYLVAAGLAWVLIGRPVYRLLSKVAKFAYQRMEKACGWWLNILEVWDQARFKEMEDRVDCPIDESRITRY